MENELRYFCKKYMNGGYILNTYHDGEYFKKVFICENGELVSNLEGDDYVVIEWNLFMLFIILICIINLFIYFTPPEESKPKYNEDLVNPLLFKREDEVV